MNHQQGYLDAQSNPEPRRKQILFSHHMRPCKMAEPPDTAPIVMRDKVRAYFCWKVPCLADRFGDRDERVRWRTRESSWPRGDDKSILSEPRGGLCKVFAALRIDCSHSVVDSSVSDERKVVRADGISGKASGTESLA